MWRLFKPLKIFWEILVVVTLLGVLVNLLSEFVISGTLRIHPNVTTLVVANYRWLTLPALVAGLLTLIAWWSSRRREAGKVFEVLKPAGTLTPEDIGFSSAALGVNIVDRRPFNRAYISRKMCPYSHITVEDPKPVFHEEDLAYQLRDGKGFVLIGPPLAGKSRTLYEIVKQLQHMIVLIPDRLMGIPNDVAFAYLKHKEVVLLLQDLTSYVYAPLDLLEFTSKLTKYASSVVVAAACRDGAELELVRNLASGRVHRFYEEIPLNLLGFVPLTTEEKEELASKTGIKYDPTQLYSTPGSIIMAEPLRYMQQRYDRLSGIEKDTLRCIRLLIATGIFPITHKRINAALRRVFDASQLDLATTRYVLIKLANESFLRGSGEADPIEVEHAYILYVVKDPDIHDAVEYNLKNVAVLVETMEKIRDDEALYQLGGFYLFSLREFHAALNCFDSVLKIAPHSAGAWSLKGTAFNYLHRPNEALPCFERAIQLQPEFPAALVGKGASLATSGDYAKALKAYDQALVLEPEFPEAWFSKFMAHGMLNETEEALAAYKHTLHPRLDRPEDWFGKFAILAKLGQREEALKAYERAKLFEPHDKEAWRLKAELLQDIGCNVEALATSLMPALLGYFDKKLAERNDVNGPLAEIMPILLNLARQIDAEESPECIYWNMVENQQKLLLEQVSHEGDLAKELHSRDMVNLREVAEHFNSALDNEHKGLMNSFTIKEFPEQRKVFDNTVTDLYIGTSPLGGMEAHWRQTSPGKYLILVSYSLMMGLHLITKAAFSQIPVTVEELRSTINETANSGWKEPTSRVVRELEDHFQEYREKSMLVYRSRIPIRENVADLCNLSLGYAERFVLACEIGQIIHKAQVRKEGNDNVPDRLIDTFEPDRIGLELILGEFPGGKNHDSRQMRTMIAGVTIHFRLLDLLEKLLPQIQEVNPSAFSRYEQLKYYVIYRRCSVLNFGLTRTVNKVLDDIFGRLSFYKGPEINAWQI